VIGQLTSLALMIAALLLALSLPFGEHDAGRSLRRAAAFAFVLAFVPATLACLVGPLFHRPHSAGNLIELLLAVFGIIGILVVLSLASYGFLDLRKRSGTRQPFPHADRGYAKRRPAERTTAHENDEEDEDSSA
jgi:hypothetical protein